MAEVLDRRGAGALYDRDYAAWARQQADLLRARRFEDLDVVRLAKEMDELAVNARQAVFSRTRRILQHFLKLAFSPAERPRRGWRETIVTQRSDLEEILTESLKNDLAAAYGDIWRRARRDALKDLAQDGLGEDDLPRECPYLLEQVLDPDWLPANVRGLDNSSTTAD